MKLVRALALALPLMLAAPGPSASADIATGEADNSQEGDNERDSDQDGEAESGDAVSGQVVGVQSSGDARVDATNHTEDSSAESGDAHGENSASAFVGHHVGEEINVLADILSGAATNVQEGDNAAAFAQDVHVASGDAVAGQVSGVVTTAGGTVDLVEANTTIDSDVETGDADSENSAISVVGLLSPTGTDGGGSGLVLDISDAETIEEGTLAFIVSVRRFSFAKPTLGKRAGAAGSEEPPGGGGIGFCYATSDGSATHEGFSGSPTVDYVPAEGCSNIPPGSSSTTIHVDTTDDDLPDCQPGEPVESMHVTITSATVPIGDGGGVGTIVDGPC